MSDVHEAAHRDPTWPYEDVEDAPEAIDSEPRWACAAGHCTCHPDREDDAPKERFCIALCDEHAARMPGARVRVLAQGILLNEDTPHADAAGWITVEARHLPEQVLVEWAPPDTPLDPRYPFRTLYYVDPGRFERHEAAHRRLHNLGFSSRLTLEDNIRALQRAYDQPQTGRLEDVEAQLVAFHDAGTLPPRGEAPAPTPLGFERASFAENDGPAPKAPPAPPAPATPPPAPKPGLLSKAKVKNRKLVVRWPNPRSEFLRDNVAGKSAHFVMIKVDGELLRSRNEDGALDNGHWQIAYEIPEGAQQLELHASFRPILGTPGDEPKKEEADERYEPGQTVFEAFQRYVVDDAASDDAVVLIERADPDPRTSRRVFDGLVTVWNQQVSPDKPAVQITLLTHFVDVTEIYKHYVGEGTYSIYENTYAFAARRIDPGGAPWTALRILGFTGPTVNGTALLWFAFCPGKVRSDAASSQLDCLLLCRHETHVKLPTIRTFNLAMSWITKFLFDRQISEAKLVDSGDGKTKKWEPVSYPALTAETPGATWFKQRYRLYFRAGFARAMARSKRNVFLLCPIPSEDSSPDMFGPKPEETVAQAIRYLWARNGIVREPGSVSPPKPKFLAAGFSSGGNALFSLLHRMGDKLSAILSMDTIDNIKHEVALAKMPQVIRWLDGDASRRFVMIVGQNGRWARDGKGALEPFVDGSTFKKYDGSTGKARQLYVFPDEKRRYAFYYPGPPGDTHPKIGPVWYATVTKQLPRDDAAWDLVEKPLKGPRRLFVGKTDKEGDDEAEAHHGWAFHGGPDEGAETDPKKVNTTDYETWMDRFLTLIP
ncbi:MAG: hypothetical protein QM820_09760 [Minicystis sp.]